MENICVASSILNQATISRQFSLHAIHCVRHFSSYFIQICLWKVNLLTFFKWGGGLCMSISINAMSNQSNIKFIFNWGLTVRGGLVMAEWRKLQMAFCRLPSLIVQRWKTWEKVTTTKITTSKTKKNIKKFANHHYIKMWL